MVGRVIVSLFGIGLVSAQSGGDEVPFPAPVVNLLVSNGNSLEASLGAQEIASRDAQLAALRAASGSAGFALAGKSAGIGAAVRKAKSFMEGQVEPKWDSAFEAQVEEELKKQNCPACVETFRRMSAVSQNATLAEAIPKMAEIEMERATQALAEEAATPLNNRNGTMSLTSFLGHKARMGTGAWNPLDTPCFDEKSCQLMSLGANKCNFGRIATLATYSAVNIATHIYAAIQTVLCGCIHVGRAGFCLLSTQFFCNLPHSMYLKLKGQSESIWESVVSRTKACRMNGHALISS